jgi:hypothetical protein
MGLFDGLIGGGSDYNAGKYGGMADDYQHKADIYAGNLGGQISQYGDIANGGRSAYNRYTPAYYGAIDASVKRLQQNPFTQQSHDSYLANRMGATTAAYNQSRASMAKNGYLRGLDTPESGGASSAYAGNDAYLQNQQLGRLNSAENGYADWAGNEQNSREQQLTSLLGGVRSDGLSQWNSGLGSQASGNQWLSNTYDNRAQRYYAMQQQAQQMQQQDSVGFGDLIGGAASLYGAGAFGHGPKKP